jgi:hypothetical protein
MALADHRARGRVERLVLHRCPNGNDHLNTYWF